MKWLSLFILNLCVLVASAQMMTPDAIIVDAFSHKSPAYSQFIYIQTLHPQAKTKSEAPVSNGCYYFDIKITPTTIKATPIIL